MIGFLAGAVVLFMTIFAIIQLAFLWAGQGAVDTAAHFAARKFSLIARSDFRKAKEAALQEAASLCRHRFGGNFETAGFTSLDFSRGGEEGHSSGAAAGDAFRVRLTHGVELIVPWIDRILYAVAPVPKTQIGGKYYFMLRATRWVTVE
jgi:hypothetical protein